MKKIKICGITESKNALELARLELDYMGLIFTKSPRQVSFEKAVEIASIINEHGKKSVGVFVDEKDELILELAKACKLKVVQVYKNISKSLYEDLKALNLELWQVLSINEDFKKDLSEQVFADLILFDTKGKFKGGNGLSFDWKLLDEPILQAFLSENKLDFGLAGGIGLENIKEALKTKALLLDLNSRVEIKAGLKDISLVEKIIKELGE
ncbi:N-(5'-phosphoribosyl)anthranilate isomerase [Campylobacter sp. MIT 99-7217]|uniref:phosphoribosylanthranilate isomerase n=1 Tax=Campylobacter sp. MIT 99-7217 TaxID=535091 RepID=UPI001159A58B|nr:phosphoribosylanthranilate isomerase [Campylobacter sp. MIT 99-7217]TQR33121.1 N-(5'-phosphoribosyl)anthranilate isomerase [Campylobacter sp. MIT 99-7217]